MEDILSKLIGLLRAMWRYRWWGLFTAWLMAVAAGAMIYKMPDKYQSSARVFVDTQSVLRPLMSGLAVQPNVNQQVEILSRTLISRPNVEKLITMADLDLSVNNAQQRDALIARLMRDLRIRTGGRDNIFTLSFQDENPEQAQRVVQALVSLFVESGLVGKRQDTDTARRFLDEQIAQYETRLTEAENRLKDFRLRHMALLGDGGGDYISRIAQVSAQLEQARLELREIETTRDVLARQLVGEEPVLLPNTTGRTLSTVPEIDARIDTLNKTLDGLLLRYTDSHPDVQAVRKLIEDLEAQRRAEAEVMAASGIGQFGTLDANPVYQQMKLAHADAEARAGALRARVSAFEQRLAELRERSELIPQLEAERAQLNRDYDVQRRNYDQLVTRRESASMSVEMAAQAGIADFRVIDPPSLPAKPSAPNRILLVPVAGVAALAAGLALMFLLAQLRPTFIDGRSLREVSGLPVLGMVTHVTDARAQRRQRFGRWAFSILLLMYGAALGAAVVMLKMMQH